MPSPSLRVGDIVEDYLCSTYARVAPTTRWNKNSIALKSGGELIARPRYEWHFYARPSDRAAAAALDEIRHSQKVAMSRPGVTLAENMMTLGICVREILAELDDQEQETSS